MGPGPTGMRHRRWRGHGLDFVRGGPKIATGKRKQQVWNLMKSLRVLIADDDGLTLMVLRKILSAMGHTVVGEAGDGQQAVTLARETSPDLIILDIRMPKMDGLEAARVIQAQRMTPIIILSAYTESGLGSEAAGALPDDDVCGFIPRPREYRLCEAGFAKILLHRSVRL